MYDLFKEGMYEKIGNRATRANDGYRFDMHIPRTRVYARSPYYMGAVMWENLPLRIRQSNTKSKFKQELKAFLG